MRLQEISPEKLSPDQLAFHDEMVKMLESAFTGFTLTRPDGALVGPMNVLVHYPEFGRRVWDFFTTLVRGATLPKTVREVVILVTGTRFASGYELYAHEKVASQVGLAAEQIATIVSGQRPADLKPEEALAYDLASALHAGGPIADASYNLGVKTFGEAQMAEFAYLVGGYSVVAILINMFNTTVDD